MINSTDTFVFRRVHPVSLTVSNGRASVQELVDLVGSSIEIPSPQSSLPVGGATGQVLTKNSPADFDVSWTTISGGGGGGSATNLTYTASTRTLNSSTGTGTTLPLFTVSDAGLAPASGGGTSNFLRADGVWAAPPGGGGGGVTSVSGTGTVSGLTLTGTVTSTGNLTLGGALSVLPSNFASQTANTFLAAPNGSAGTPTFRSIVAADIPILNQSTTGSAATLTTSRAITMTGDVSWTVSFNGGAAVSAAGTIQNAAVTYAKIQDVAANSVLARAAATSGAVGAVALSTSQLFGRGSSGDLAPITLGTNLSMSGTTLNATGGGGTTPNTYTDPTQTAGPSVFETFFHFPPGFKFLSNIGNYGVFTEAGSTFTSNAYLSGTSLDAQAGVMVARTAASATLQRPTFSLLDNNLSPMAGNGLTIGMAALVKFRPAAASNAPSATNDYWVSVGFQGANSNRIDATVQLKFDYYWTGSAVAFEASSREGGGSVTTTALTIPTAGTYTLLSVECVGLNVTFRVNGVSVATRTMTVASSAMRPQILINQTTAANVNGIDVDWATFYVKGLAR